MSSDALSAVEELIGQAGECPPLSHGLKERVIAESVAARQRIRRRLRFDHVFAVSGLCLWMGMVIWQHAAFWMTLSPQKIIRRQIALATRLVEVPVSESADPQNAVADGSRKEWGEVKKLEQSKSSQLSLLQSAFGS